MIFYESSATEAIRPGSRQLLPPVVMTVLPYTHPQVKYFYTYRADPCRHSFMDRLNPGIRQDVKLRKGAGRQAAGSFSDMTVSRY